MSMPAPAGSLIGTTGGVWPGGVWEACFPGGDQGTVHYSRARLQDRNRTKAARHRDRVTMALYSLAWRRRIEVAFCDARRRMTVPSVDQRYRPIVSTLLPSSLVWSATRMDCSLPFTPHRFHRYTALDSLRGGQDCRAPPDLRPRPDAEQQRTRCGGSFTACKDLHDGGKSEHSH
jgi:hypothetical protein